MSLIETKSKFHVALDGVGLLLQGAPENPAYQISDSPVYGARFASGDRDYNDLSQWWYLIQTDWSGGVKDTTSWEDDAKFYYSTNIDAYTKPGSLQLEKLVRSGVDNTANLDTISDVRSILYDDSTKTLLIDGDNIRLLSTLAIVASGGTHDVQNYLGFKNFLWVFYRGSSGVQNFDGTTESDKTSQINAIANGIISEAWGGVVIGGTMYVFTTASNGWISCSKTTVANPTASGDWSVVWETELTIGAFVSGIAVLGGEIIFMVADSTDADIADLYSLDVSSGIAIPFRRFNSNYNTNDSKGGKFVTNFIDKILVTVPSGVSGDEGDIYEYDGSSFTRIKKYSKEKEDLGEEANYSIEQGCVVMDDKAYWGNLVYDGISFYNFVKDIDDIVTAYANPVGYAAETHTMYLDSTNSSYLADEYDSEETSFKTGADHEAFAVFNMHDKLQSIDKLLNSVTIGFDKLLSGQKIEIYYTKNSVPYADLTAGSWTLLGDVNYTDDGGDVVSKVLKFPEGVNAKKVWFRVELSSGGFSTPRLIDFTLEYLPLPDYKMEWGLNINCADEVEDLSGRKVETTGRELRSQLMAAWQTKSALDFQDLDYASTTLSDNPLTDAATIVNAGSTVDFPEKGRIKIEDEEMYYTGKTPTSFTGVTRGTRGTAAVSHAQNSQIHNAYRVLVIKMNAQVPTMSEDKNLEYIVGFNLREV